MKMALPWIILKHIFTGPLHSFFALRDFRFLKIKKTGRAFFFIFFIPVSLYGQFFDSVSIEKKIKFINYLKENKQTEDALYILNYFNSKADIDSLKLMEVKLLFELKREKDADSLLEKCVYLFSDTSKLRCSYNLLKNHANLLNQKFEKIGPPECSAHAAHQEIWRLQLLSAAILKKETGDFDLVFNSGKCSVPDFSLIEFSLYVTKTEISRRRKKSPFAAGLLSVIFPGAGKLYAGKPREALSTFIPVVFNFAQAAEGYYYRKFESPHFYIFGSIGTVFYASGIYGSALAAKRKNHEFDDKIKMNVEYEITKLIRFY